MKQKILLLFSLLLLWASLQAQNTTWTAQSSSTTNYLRGVWTTDTSNAWSVGFFGTIRHKAGAIWTTQGSSHFFRH